MTVIILSGVLGFLLASLIALFLAPPLWRKAVKVTTKKLLQQSPRVMSEGQADRDQMRAEFAITTAKMEAKIEQLREASDTQLIELSTTEKKRERLLEKIKSLQTTLEDREKVIEKLNRKIEPLAAHAHELDQYKQKNSQLSKKLETHNQAVIDLKQEVGTGKAKIIDLIGKIEAKNNSITQLTREIEALKSLEISPPPFAKTQMRRPAHPKLRSGKKPKTDKTPETLSLAERIRSLQSDHPKSI